MSVAPSMHCHSLYLLETMRPRQRIPDALAKTSSVHVLLKKVHWRAQTRVQEVQSISVHYSGLHSQYLILKPWSVQLVADTHSGSPCCQCTGDTDSASHIRLEREF